MSNVAIQHPQDIDDREMDLPTCSGCGKGENVAPAVVAHRGPFFCMRCCNYLDRNGAVSA